MKRRSCLLSILLLPSLAGLAAAEPPELPSAGALRDSLRAGMDFLVAVQRESGEFRTYACTDAELRSCRFESSPFVTSFVVHALEALDDERTAGAKDRALDFLAAEQLENGSWRYYGRSDGKEIPPDLDDTAVASAALTRAGRSIRPNDAIFDANRRPDGVYRTWVPDRSSAEAERIHRALAEEVDCAVNANVLFHRQRSEEGACRYIVRSLRSSARCSDWYPDRLTSLYMAARALSHGVDCLAVLERDILTQVASRRRDDGSFGDSLSTALATNALLDIGFSGPMVAGGIAALLGEQRDDGSWPRAPFFQGPTTFYGSEEATTALALEAIAGYLSAVEGAPKAP